MRRMVVLVALVVLATGCVAQGEDPFAYTKKPLYASSFQLAQLGEDGESQEFRVTDGSILRVRVQVWVNATEGSGQVEIRNPSGDVVMSTTESADRSYPLALGAWTVHVTGQPGESGGPRGDVGILVTRG